MLHVHHDMYRFAEVLGLGVGRMDVHGYDHHVEGRRGAATTALLCDSGDC